MSAKQKRSPKTKGPSKEKQKTVKKRKVTEEKKLVTVPVKKVEKAAAVKPETKVEKVVLEVRGETFLLGYQIARTIRRTHKYRKRISKLKLNHKFRAVLLEKNGSMLGTLRKVKDYVTWGEVRSHDITALLKKRGELSNGMAFNDKFVKENFGHESVDELALAIARGQIDLKALWVKGVVPVFRLHPPSGGFEGSIKRPYGSRGELGYRGAEISHLVARMM